MGYFRSTRPVLPTPDVPASCPSFLTLFHPPALCSAQRVTFLPIKEDALQSKDVKHISLPANPSALAYDTTGDFVW